MIKVYEQPEKRDKCISLLEDIKKLDEGYWVDKSKNIINYGINGEIGKYSAIHYESIPNDIKEKILEIIPKHDKFPINNFMINRYKKDEGFLPFHSDLVETLAFSIVFLTETNGDGLSYKDRGEIVKVQDKIGSYVIPNTLNLVHGVPEPVSEDRYTIITVYR